MILRDLLGRFSKLTVVRLGPPGAFFAVDPLEVGPAAPAVLLPRSEVPEGTKPGDAIEAFVHLDSDDRPVATLRRPKLELGEVAFLAVTDLTPFGAFVDWGLPKELLVPLAEQTRDLKVGDRHPIALYIDDTGRLAGTMRVSERLGASKRSFALDEWVEGEAWRNDPDIGLFVIVERTCVGLVPANEPHELMRGQAGRFRIASVLPDGKVDLSLRGHAHEEVESDARKILALLARGDADGVGNQSTPEEIRAIFGLSKKAFKRASGRLLKEGSVTFDDDGFLVASRRPAGS